MSILINSNKTMAKSNYSEEKFPVVIKDVSVHTMEDQLHRYLDIKMHHLIKDRDYEKILIRGEYNRNETIGLNEKQNKIFNWQRPTARVKDNILTIFVPTGRDYVLHYASLIATYLAINNRNYNHVSYIKPSSKQCEDLALESNLGTIRPRKIVVIGFGLTDISDAESWKGEGAFLYKNETLGINEVTLLGCKHSLWGDIAEGIAKYLARNLGVKSIIYIGKLGSLNDQVEPNSFLATGNFSFVKGKNIIWKNLFENVDSKMLLYGKHYNSPSTLFEDKKWLVRNKKFDFVDPEIGYFAKGAVESGINFSYLHIISNNLTQTHKENLSNEREQNILEKRKKLLAEIKRILSSTNLSKKI